MAGTAQRDSRALSVGTPLKEPRLGNQRSPPRNGRSAAWPRSSQHLIRLLGGSLQKSRPSRRTKPGCPAFPRRSRRSPAEPGRPATRSGGGDRTGPDPAAMPLRSRHPVQFRDPARFLLARDRVRPQKRCVLQQRRQRLLAGLASDSGQDHVISKAGAIGQGQVIGEPRRPVESVSWAPISAPPAIRCSAARPGPRLPLAPRLRGARPHARGERVPAPARFRRCGTGRMRGARKPAFNPGWPGGSA